MPVPSTGQSTPEGIRILTERVLSSLPLPIGLRVHNILSLFELRVAAIVIEVVTWHAPPFLKIIFNINVFMIPY